MPNQTALSSSERSKCGRRERESRREGRREQSLRETHSFACRGGLRHPDFQEGGSLRGASSERRSWSVRFEGGGSSAANERADDSGCPEVAEEGNAVGMRHKAHAPVAGTRDRRKRTGDASFARSFDPCTSILTMLRRGNSRRWGVSIGITVGQTHESEKNHHWGWCGRTERGSPRVTASARERACHVRTGRRSRPSSLRGSWGARVWLPARRSAVAEVSRRRLVSNKLGKRAPKRAAGSS
jgi:hypothetical protein